MKPFFLILLALQAAQFGCAAPLSIAVFDLNACFDGEKVDKVTELNQELKVMAGEIAKRGVQAPEEREKLRAEYLALYERRKLEIYTMIDKVVMAIAKERNLTAVFKLDPLPQIPINKTDTSLSQQLDRRQVFFSSPQIDITAEVLKRLNEAFPPPPKEDSR